MEYDSVLGQQSISGKNVSLILCVWKPCYVKSGHILLCLCTCICHYVYTLEWKNGLGRIPELKKKLINMYSAIVLLSLFFGEGIFVIKDPIQNIQK